MKDMGDGKTLKSSVVAEGTMVVALSFRILNIPLSTSYRKARVIPLKVPFLAPPRIIMEATWEISTKVRAQIITPPWSSVRGNLNYSFI